MSSTLRLVMTCLLVCVARSVLASPPSPTTTRQADVDRLLSLHNQVLQAHRDGDLDAWLRTESDDYVLVSRGEILAPDKQARRAQLGPYLANTTFSVYEDLVPPQVRVSEDGTLGWLVAQVHVVGATRGADGSEETFDDVWAWIELFEKRDGQWLRTGNVSNLKPETPTSDR